MKINLSRRYKKLGNALLISMCISAFLCVSIVGYLTVAQQQTVLSARSQAWNMSIATVEAGLEEGLQHVQTNTNNLSADGWTYDGSQWYSHSNYFTSDGSSYVVAVNQTNIYQPIVVCRANIPASTMVFLAAAGVNVPKPPINRAVALHTTRSVISRKAMVARRRIDLNGNNVSTDSFDSCDPAKSTFGEYDPSRYVGDNGDVASNDTITNSISVGNADIHGHVSTGPNGTVTWQTGGGVGSHAWLNANSGLEPNGMEGQVWVSHDANFTFPDTSLPYTNGLAPLQNQTVVTVSNNGLAGGPTTQSTYPNPPPWDGVRTKWICGAKLNSATLPAPGTYCPQNGITTNGSGVKYSYWTIGGVSYTYNQYTTNVVYATNTYDFLLNQSADYYLSSGLSGKVLVTGNARLVLPNGLNMSGQDTITIGQNGALQMFTGGNSATIGGNGVINQNGKSYAFILWCAPSVTTFTLNGNGEFNGVVVAPNADTRMNGGGSGVDDFIGALIVNSVTMNGHFNFHYDECLGRQPIYGRLLITSWDEVNPLSAPGY